MASVGLRRLHVGRFVSIAIVVIPQETNALDFTIGIAVIRNREGVRSLRDDSRGWGASAIGMR